MRVENNPPIGHKRFPSGFAWIVYGLAWITFAAGYAAVYLLTEQGTLLDAGSAAVGVVLPAALLGLSVVWSCKHIPAPDLKHLWSIPIHLVLTLLYPALWIGLVLGTGIVSVYFSSGRWVFWLPPDHVMHWHFLAGSMIYITLASVMYAVDGIVEARIQGRQTELQMLRAQLNPHFLFNTLHTVHALVRRAPDAAEEALEQFADLLRYILRTQKETVELVDFSKEWKFTQDYLDLERLRLGERLRIETDVAPDTHTCRVPILLLQPLVENAIRHAIAPRPSGGTMWLQARCCDEDLHITVKDDGPGAAPHEVENAEGIGLRAIRERLRLYYGNASRFHIDTCADKGFTVTIQIPADGLPE